MIKINEHTLKLFDSYGIDRKEAVEKLKRRVNWTINTAVDFYRSKRGEKLLGSSNDFTDTLKTRNVEFMGDVQNGEYNYEAIVFLREKSGSYLSEYALYGDVDDLVSAVASAVVVKYIEKAEFEKWQKFCGAVAAMSDEKNND